MDEISGNKTIAANILPDIDSNLLPELFADFFVENISKIRSKFDCSDQDENDDTCAATIPHADGVEVALSEQNDLGSFHLLTVDEVVKIVRSMNAKSCTLDPIPTKFVKDCINLWAPVLTHIVNCSFRSGIIQRNHLLSKQYFLLNFAYHSLQ